MSVIRIKKDTNFFAASNVPFNDIELSWEARGLMGYLLSKSDNWQIMFNDLVKKGPAGAHKIRRILRELQDKGYLKRERKQGEGGKFYWESVVYETPTISRKSIDGETILRSSINGSSIYGKSRDILSTESPNTELSKKEGAGKKQPASPPPPVNGSGEKTVHQQMFDALQEATHLDAGLNGGKIGKFSQRIIKAGYTSEQVKACYMPGGWWYTEDWRGRDKNEPPTLEQINDTIQRAVAGEKSNGNYHFPPPLPASYQKKTYPEDAVAEYYRLNHQRLPNFTSEQWAEYRRKYPDSPIPIQPGEKNGNHSEVHQTA
jgi:hypothetical protein